VTRSRIALAAALLCAVAACSKQPQPAPTPDTAPTGTIPGAAEPGLPLPGSARPAARRPEGAPPAIQENLPTPSLPDDADEDSDDTPASQQKVAELRNAYAAAADPDRKTEILFEIGDIDTPTAGRALSQMLLAEPSPEFRARLLMVLSDVALPDADKLPALMQFIGPEQPAEVRENAIEALDNIDDPRAIPLWQRLLGDPDEDVRETAGAAIERLRRPPDPDDE
jgi:hypothetical protein